MKKTRFNNLLAIGALIVVGLLALSTGDHLLRPQQTVSTKMTIENDGKKSAPASQTPLLDTWSRVRRKVRSWF